MRSSKSRSRSKSNRNRPSGGNIINRVFDSSGPEGKVRGTPQQIIDKYNQLARDAQLAGDRVATENFQQHAEHYLRLLSEAQREQEAKREEQERQNRERQAQRDRERAERDAERAQQQENRKEERSDRQERPEQEDMLASLPVDQADAPQPDVIDPTAGGQESGLVETPEDQAEKPKPPTRSRRTSSATKKPSTRKAKPKATAESAEAPETPKAAEKAPDKASDEPSQAAE